MRAGEHSTYTRIGVLRQNFLILFVSVFRLNMHGSIDQGSRNRRGPFAEVILAGPWPPEAEGRQTGNTMEGLESALNEAVILEHA